MLIRNECKQQVNINPNSYAIGPGYFSTIGQSLRRQAATLQQDDDGRNHVAIVNQALAAREWPGQSALGHRVHTGEIHVEQGDELGNGCGRCGQRAHLRSCIRTGTGYLHSPRRRPNRALAFSCCATKADPAAFKNAARVKLKREFPEATGLRGLRPWKKRCRAKYLNASS